MRKQQWLVAGVSTCFACWIGLLARGSQETTPAAAAAAQAKDKDAGKSSSPGDAKPAPYPEDALLHPDEIGYRGSGAYRWLNVALQATAREHERYGARPTVGS